MPTTIYALRDPRSDDAVRYVGKTKHDPAVRLKQHLQAIVRARRGRWIDGLKKNHLKPIIEVLEIVDDGAPWEPVERHWIAHFRAAGERLLNETDGGDGCLGRPRTPEEKERIARKQRGRKFDPEHRAKLSAARLGVKPWNTGVPHAPATREKLRLANVGKKQSPELIARRIAASVESRRRGAGWAKSDETRAKISASKMGKKARPLSPEQDAERMAKVWAARRAHGTDKHTEEARAKMAASRTGLKRGRYALSEEERARRAEHMRRVRRSDPETVARRAAGVKARWASRTPEERAAIGARISARKRKRISQ
jgi:hypothetical protein